VTDRTANGAAIVGIGATEFSKDSQRTEMRLAVEAIHAALQDAGIAASEVDGMVTYAMDTNDEIEIARNLGIGDLSFFARVPHGGGAACATIHQAAMAVATGSAEVVVCYRALNGRSWLRFGAAFRGFPEAPTADAVHYSWYVPFGLITPAGWVAMFARRYMHEFGATSEDFGRVSVAARSFAATNPSAYFYERPISLEDHQRSRWIVEPLRLLDCCQESDGAVAIVVTSSQRARDLLHPVVEIVAAAQGAGRDQESMTSFYRDDISGLPEMGVVARRLWEKSGLGPDDIQTAIVYDHFTPFVLAQLEEFGFCGRGEAPDFVRNGNLERGGRLPANTNGGQIGEAYIHGMNGIAEGVRQVRGSSANQIDDVQHVLVTAGTGVPTSGLILGKG
jgi:acetyl-CoA acetyltransferase